MSPDSINVERVEASSDIISSLLITFNAMFVFVSKNVRVLGSDVYGG